MIEPRVARWPKYRTTSGDDAVRLAASCGLVLDDWQQYLLRHSLGEQDDGRWAATEVGLLVPRQNGKSYWVAARALAGLYLFDERLIVLTTHQGRTTAEQFRLIKQLVEGNPHLASRTKRIWTGSGNETIELKNGNRIRFIARSKNSGRGFSADTLLLDEAQELSDLAYGALVPTMSARPNPQIIYAGTVPSAENNSEVWTRIRDRGRAAEGDPRLAWFEYSAGEDVGDLDDIERWKAANPAWGKRIDREFCEVERGALSEDAFARERLSIWPSGINAGLFGPAWSECLTPGSQIVSDLAFGVAVTYDRTTACISAAGNNAEGLLHVEPIEHKRGTDWVVARVKELLAAHGRRPVVIDQTGPTDSLVRDLQNAGVSVTVTSTKDATAACGAFYDLVQQREVAHLGNPELDEAVLGASKRTVGDRWLLSRKNAVYDISPLEAAVLAAWASRATADYDVLASVW